MSQKLISHSQDLKKLRDEGYEVEIQDGFLIISNVPYLNSDKKVLLGKLITNLDLAGETTAKPKTHVVYFQGDHPCNDDGTEIAGIKNASNNQDLSEHIKINHTFSNRPPEGYMDYFHKMENYIKIISAPARSVTPSATAKTFKVVEASEDDESVFHYFDTNSSRAEISVLSTKFKGQKIAIIGLGGTGSYLLDFIAKTPVSEIHLFDADEFLQHNAFRTPGAASIDDLNKRVNKIEYLEHIYSKMRKGIILNATYISKENLDLLSGFNYVFICIDKGEVKQHIFNFLNENKICAIDVGMGIELVDDSLIGTVRVTTSMPKNNSHLRNRVSFSNGDDDDYSQNIQIAELNALNAALAVIKWKKLCGYYQDLEKELHSLFMINVNQLTGSDHES